MSDNSKRIIDNCLQACADWGLIPTAFRQCMTWEEQVLWLTKFLQTEVIPKTNENILKTKELEEWFNNLDVQEEVNNKLDEMAESGELAAIIAEYLNAKAVMCFNTVAEMKAADNLIEGALAETFGFYNVGDGGGAKYRIRTVTSGDTVDEIHLFALSSDPTLVAELNEGASINVLQLGAVADNETDSTDAIDYALQNFETVTFPQGTFICNSTNVQCAASKIYGTNLTEIKASVADEASYMWVFPNTLSSNVEIKNMKFNSNLLRRGCVNISAHQMCNIENCEFTGYSLESGHYGTDSLIIFNGGDLVYVNDCYFHDSGYQYPSGELDVLNRCITAQDVNEFHCENCKFERVMQAIVTANHINFIHNCHFDYLKDNCIYNLTSNSGLTPGRLIATDCYFANRNSEGIVTSGKENIIKNNIFENIPNSAISINNSMDTLIVEGNIFKNLVNDDSTATGTVIKDRSSSTHTIGDFIFSNNVVDVSSKPAQTGTGNILYVGTATSAQMCNNNIKYQSIASGRAIEFYGLTYGNLSDNIITDTRNDATVRVFQWTNSPETLVCKNNLCGNQRITTLRDYSYTTEWVQTNTGGYIKSVSGGRIVYGSVIPSAGTWKRGDIVFNTSPSAGGTLGWVCVTEGTPGTWKAISGIAA